jgi:hypothetical protein
VLPKTFLACGSDCLANSLFNQYPTTIKYTNAEFRTASCIHFGLPIDACRQLIGLPIRDSERTGRVVVDIHGYNILNVSNIAGDHRRQLHDETTSVFFPFLKKAGIGFTGNAGNTCKNIFAEALRGNMEDRVMQGIIPDGVIRGENFAQIAPGNTYAGVSTMFDTKTIGPLHYFSNTFEGHSAVNKRAEEVNREYYAKAKQLDREHNGVLPGEVGPVEQILRSYGINGQVRGTVVGTFGECSTDFHELRRFITTVLADKEINGTNLVISDVKGRIAKRFLAVMGHTIHRGWSRLLLGRIPIIRKQGNQEGAAGNGGDEEDEEDIQMFTHLNLSQ